jgi:hypothetical protein
MSNAQSSIPPWLAAVIIVVVVAVVAIGGFMFMNRSGSSAALTPAEIEATQTAEKPGDAPSGRTDAAQDNQSAN